MIFTPPSGTPYHRAAWLICSLALFALAAVACEIEADLPPRVAVAPTPTSEPAETPAPESTPAQTPAPTQEPVPTQNPTATPEPASEPTQDPTATPAPEPQPGQAAGRSRFNPVPLGRYAESADGLFAFAVVSTDMDADFSALMAEIPYYDPDDPDYQLAEGNRLVAARALVQNIGGEGDNALLINEWSSFSVVGSSEIEFFERGCRATFKDAALFPGEIAEINVCFEVPESETDLVLIHTSLLDLLYAKPSGNYTPQLEEPRRWLAFGNPDTVEAPRVAETTPEPAPHREYTLAPAGSTVVTDNGIALTITSFTPDAKSVLASENPDYEPREGYRHLIARLRVQNVGGSENNPIPEYVAIGNLWLIDAASAPLGSMAETVGHRHCGMVPDDIERFHEAASLFPGGTLEGNLCFDVPKAETDLVLMYDTRDEGYDNQKFLALANPDSVDPVRTVDAPLDPQAVGRSRFNPVPPGGYVESADGLLAFAMVSVDMDADISAIPYSGYYDRGNPYYHPPAEGNRLIAARVRVQNIGGDVDSVLTADDGQFAIVGSSGIESYHYNRGCRATLDPPELFLGGIVEINVCFEAPESETDLVLNHASGEWGDRYYSAPDSDEGPRRWLAFGNPDTVEAARVVDASPEPDGQASGRSRSAAAPFGASVYDQFGMAISIVSAMDATDEILKYNPYNDPPAEGNRFIMARARLEWVGGNASDNANVSRHGFGLAGSSAVVFSHYDNSCGEISHALPILELSGGEAGEIDVCFEIPQSETDLILFYGDLYNDSARWLRLPER